MTNEKLALIADSFRRTHDFHTMVLNIIEVKGVMKWDEVRAHVSNAISQAGFRKMYTYAEIEYKLSRAFTWLEEMLYICFDKSTWSFKVL